MYKTFEQKYQDWTKIKIPGTDLDIGRYGCAVCCLASLAYYYGKNETPLSLIVKLDFDNGLVVWSSLEKVCKNIVFKKRVRLPDWDEIDRSLEKEEPVIVKINVAKSGDEFLDHWIVIWRKAGKGNYIISDSRKAFTTNLKFSNLKDSTIYAATFFEKIAEAEKTSDTGEQEKYEPIDEQNLLRDILKKIKELVVAV